MKIRLEKKRDSSKLISTLPLPPPLFTKRWKQSKTFFFFNALAFYSVLVLLGSEPGGRGTDLTVCSGATTDNALVDSSLDTVVHFDVELGHVVVLVDRRLADITERGGVDNVSHNETLDGLVLGDGFSGGNTADTLDVSSSLLVASVAASFHSHN